MDPTQNFPHKRGKLLMQQGPRPALSQAASEAMERMAPGEVKRMAIATGHLSFGVAQDMSLCVGTGFRGQTGALLTAAIDLRAG